MTWRIRSVLWESVENSLAGGARTVLLALSFAMAIGVVFVAELVATSQIRSLQSELDKRGLYVSIVRGTEDQRLHGAACVALNGQSGVVAAGGISALGTVSFDKASSTELRWIASVGIAENVWSPDFDSPKVQGILIGSGLAADIGIRAGWRLGSDLGPLIVEDVLPGSDRTTRPERWLLTQVIPTESIDECWVEFEQSSYASAREAVGAALVRDDVEPFVTDLVQRNEFTQDPSQQLVDRPQQYLWIPAGVLLGLLSAIFFWSRRREIALYRTLRMPRILVTAMLCVELMVIAMAALPVVAWWFLASGRLLAGGDLSADQITIASRGALLTLSLGLAVSSAAGLLLSAGQPGIMLKE